MESKNFMLKERGRGKTPDHRTKGRDNGGRDTKNECGDGTDFQGVSRPVSPLGQHQKKLEERPDFSGKLLGF